MVLPPDGIVKYICAKTITNLPRQPAPLLSLMTGSVLDGEDVVQEALFHAYRKLDPFDDAHPLIVPNRAQSVHRFPSPP
jgi:hypothetical protein